MSDFRPGIVLLSDEFDCQSGKLTALEGQKLVHVFLGTCRVDQVPQITGALNALGWYQTEFFEAVVEIEGKPPVEDLDPITRRTLFRAEGRDEAAAAAVRFARRQVMEAGGEMTSLVVFVVKLGGVTDDGVPNHVRAGRLLAWDPDCGSTLDSIVAGLALP